MITNASSKRVSFLIWSSTKTMAPLPGGRNVCDIIETECRPWFCVAYEIAPHFTLTTAHLPIFVCQRKIRCVNWNIVLKNSQGLSPVCWKFTGFGKLFLCSTRNIVVGIKVDLPCEWSVEASKVRYLDLVATLPSHQLCRAIGFFLLIRPKHRCRRQWQQWRGKFPRSNIFVFKGTSLQCAAEFLRNCLKFRCLDIMTMHCWNLDWSLGFLPNLERISVHTLNLVQILNISFGLISRGDLSNKSKS